MSADPHDQLHFARRQLMEALGRQSSFWGLGKTTGEMYATLFLSDRALSLGELANALGVSKGAVSIAVRNLEHLGMVRRSQRPGDRKVYLAAETDFWLIARRLLERRQKPEFDESFRLVSDSLQLTRTAPAGPERDFQLNRLNALDKFYRELDGIVDVVLALGPDRLAPLIHFGARLFRTEQ